MTLNEYQNLAKRTANNAGTKKDRIANWAFGLAGETGEFIDLLKKSVFHGHELDKKKCEKELGDILWYVSMMTDELNLNLENIAVLNIHKLAERYPDGFESFRSKYRKEYEENYGNQAKALDVD